jgi:DNA polymerase III alpha subunit
MSDPKPLSAQFVHLHVHSHYSLLNALPTPKELAKAAKEDGQDALAITDAGALYGAIDFYKACTKGRHQAYNRPRRLPRTPYSPRQRSYDRQAAVTPRPPRKELFTATKTSSSSSPCRISKASTTALGSMTSSFARTLEDLICIIPSFAGEVVQQFKNENDEKAARAPRLVQRRVW